MNRTFRCATLALLIATGVVSAQTDKGKGLIQQGLETYALAQTLDDRDARIATFERAERLFTEAARSTDASADLYANAGTAALQAEKLGPAVLAFRRALEIDPDHPRSRRNLAHARTLLPAWVPRPRDEGVLDSFLFWHRSMSSAERAAIGAFCFLLAAVGYSAAIRWRSRLARSLAWLPAVAWLGLSTSLLLEMVSGHGNQAVITAEETLARAADSSNSPTRFPDPLPGGSEVTIIELRDRWARVRLANDLDAWVSRRSLERVVESGPDQNGAI